MEHLVRGLRPGNELAIFGSHWTTLLFGISAEKLEVAVSVFDVPRAVFCRRLIHHSRLRSWPVKELADHFLHD